MRSRSFLPKPNIGAVKLSFLVALRQLCPAPPSGADVGLTTGVSPTPPPPVPPKLSAAAASGGGAVSACECPGGWGSVQCMCPCVWCDWCVVDEYCESEWLIRTGGGAGCVSGSHSAGSSCRRGRDGRSGEPSGVPCSLSSPFRGTGGTGANTSAACARCAAAGLRGDPGSGGSGGGIAMPDIGREGNALEDVISAPAVDGRGGSLDDGFADERLLSRLNDFARSGIDFLCGEEANGGSVSAADARGGSDAGEMTGEYASDIAASDPRRVRRGEAGVAGAFSARVLFRRNQPFDFFSGVRSLSFVDA